MEENSLEKGAFFGLYSLFLLFDLGSFLLFLFYVLGSPLLKDFCFLHDKHLAQ